MHLGDLWIAPEEIEGITWRNGHLTLDLRWPWEELPVLLDRSAPTLLRWHVEDDPKAGLAVELVRWRFRREGNVLRLLFRC